MSSPNFRSLGIAEPVLHAIQQLGYEQPTPIQAQCIPILLQRKNLLGTAQTGTGKTAAFALPLLSNLDSDQSTPQVLVLAPTRELAIQVAEAFQRYAAQLNNFHVLPIYGGADMRAQLRGLKRGAQVIVGTPGRVLDHVRRRSLDLSELHALILDEADEMLRMGFIEDVESILAQTPATCQRALFSATMPERIRRIAQTYLLHAERVAIDSKTKTVERIEQHALIVKQHQKLDALTRILEVENFDGMLVFVRTKSASEDIAAKLTARGFAVAPLNGDLNQAQRERTIRQLKDGAIDIVVATDVAARGLDVERISHVINYDIPYDNESYVHRIGRTGRAGRDGRAILLATPKERNLLHSIERSTRQPITPMKLPSDAQLAEQRVRQLSDSLVERIQSSDISQYRALVNEIADRHQVAMEDIAAALLMETQKERPLFPEQEEIQIQSSETSPRRKPASRQKNSSEFMDSEADAVPVRKSKKARDKESALDGLVMMSYRIEVGIEDGISVKNIVGAIANEAEIESRYIGQIDLYDHYSTVELPEGMPDELLQHLRKVRIGNKPSRMRLLGRATAHDTKSAAPVSQAKNRKSGGASARRRPQAQNHR